ncbi:MAG: hypothetical protein ABI639_14295 [Thermoanaerobaculia bacterium]
MTSFTRTLAILAGLLSAIPGTFPAPARAADGDLDPTFSGDGIVSSTHGAGAQIAYTVAPLPDGSILVGGIIGEDEDSIDFYVIRYRANGGVEPDWGNFGGRRVAIDRAPNGEDTLLKIVIDSTGAAVLLGRSKLDFADDLPALARLTPEGDIDAAFGDGGIAGPTEFPWNGSIHIVAAAEHLDGFLFLGNCSGCGAGATSGQFLYRTLASGLPDPAFGSGGWRVLDGPAPAGESAQALAVTAAGKIVVADWYTPMFPGQQLRVYRRLADGGADATWGSNGQAVRAIEDFSWAATSLALDPVDGSVIVGLRRSDDATGDPSGGLLRFSSTGVPDPTFGFPAISVEQGSTFSEIAVAGDRTIYALGSIDGTGAQPSGFFLARFLPTGALDPDFAENGVRKVEIDAVVNGYDAGYGLALCGGRPVGVGFAQTQTPGGLRFAVVRLTNELIFRDGFDLGASNAW